MAHGPSLRNMSNVTLQRDSEFERVGGEGDEYLKMRGFLFSAMLLKNLAATTAKTNPKKCVNRCAPSNFAQLQFTSQKCRLLSNAKQPNSPN